MQLINENLNDDLTQLLEDAELDEDQEKKVERVFAREYHLITRDDRLEAIAEDLVHHFAGRGHQGFAVPWKLCLIRGCQKALKKISTRKNVMQPFITL